MQATLLLNPPVARVQIHGHFTFEGHRQFKEATTAALAESGIETVEIDFAGVDYLDSAALGMLLLLNERAGGRRIVLRHAGGTVRSVLDIANFGKIFEID
ncbi:STAS domain-containing protein [Chitiniphilus shinanonensis]|uniref:STAS domain-containing protein n=1 Tax=Chitiniphilus shinanonensis TaxID=553088 RepID=A0ABQ6BS07_9NEIS|nr:STAS domain-containing protein [Chitiniphilus shinanonensis]GLS03995.1 STAS domain-containing protein [Chitiniphilus shinanonensis]